jgi:signal transduction histidine kinase
MPSIQRKLQFSLTLSIAILMLLLGWLLFVMVQQVSDSYVKTRLQHDAEALLATVQVNADGSLALINQQTGIYDQPFSGHYFVLFTPGQKLLTSRSLWDASLAFEALAAGSTRSWYAAGPAHQQLLLWAGGYSKQDKALTIVVAEDVSPLHQQFLYYSALLAGLAIIFLGVLWWVQRRIVRRAFDPLHAISAELRNLERGTTRQLADDVADEVQPLVHEVNRLVSIMDQRLSRSRNALGNLAHALKGPLNLLMQLADSEAIRQQAELHAELRAHTGRLRELIEHELKRARLAGSGGSGRHFYPAEELPVLETLLQKLYAGKTLVIQHEYPAGALGDTDRDDMLELLGNLLDNACKFAHARVAYTITLNAHIAMTVEDDGPGCPEDQLAMLAQRGVRLDESMPGHGLGLAIVRDVVELYKGSLKFDRSSSLGGLRVQVSLPIFTD